MKHGAALLLLDIGIRLLIFRDVRDAAKHIHELVVEEAAHGFHLGGIGQILAVGEQAAVGIDDGEAVVAEHSHLVEIDPCVVERLVGGCPAVLVEVLPEASVVPVAATDGDDGFVGREGVVVVESAHGALKTLRVAVAADIII